jgi:hypothetical protein
MHFDHSRPIRLGRTTETDVCRLRDRWKVFNLPLQLHLQEHLNRYGYRAAKDVTEMLEMQLSRKEDK